MLSITVGCFAGMFFDQTLTYEEHAAQWATARWKLSLFTFLELNDVFGSWWFGLLILVLLVNLVACSIERLPKIWIDIQHPQRDLSDKQLRGIKHIYRAVIDEKDRAKVERVVGAVFGSKRVDRTDENGWFSFFERHRFGRLGVYVIHTGLVTIMVGG